MNTPIRPAARTLPAHPDLDQLKRQAKELLDAYRNSNDTALAEVNAHYRAANPSTFALHDAQLVIARAYGFDSWAKLKAHVEGVTLQRFADTVRANNIAGARTMLDRRPELVHMDMAESNEHRAIHYAVLNRLPDMVRLLMERGSDARKGIWPHRDATSALTIATERGYDEILDIILAEERRRQAQHRPDPVAMPALHEFVAQAERGDEVGALSALQANPSLIHERGPDGWTPLHVATGTLSERLVGWLLDHGADVRARNVNGRTPLDTTGGRVRWDDRMAERANRIGAMLLERGADLNASTAVRTGNTEWLRRRYAEDRLSGEYGLITHAVVSNQLGALGALLELGLDPDERSRSTAVEEPVFSWGEPLRQCAIARRYDMAELLLARGADPNTNVYAASTAMFNAYEAGDQKMIALLERYGGIVDAAIAGSFGLVDRAKHMLADEAAGRLHERAVWPGGTVAGALLQSGADAGHPEIIRLALDHLDWPPGDGRWHWNLMRPLGGHADAERDRFATCFRLMIERSGANVLGPYGRTILHDVAAAWPRGSVSTADERVVLATMLLDAGARLDVRDDLLKSTPLGWACRWGRTELVELLLTRGADPIEPDAEPWATPVAWATKAKHHEVLTLLRARVAE